jgi:hypothetical protein
VAKDAIVEKGGLLGSQSNHGVQYQVEVSPAGQVVRGDLPKGLAGAGAWPRKLLEKEPFQSSNNIKHLEKCSNEILVLRVARGPARRSKHRFES